MTTHCPKYEIQVCLYSNHENRYEYKLEDLWQNIKDHYEYQAISNVNVCFGGFDWDTNNTHNVPIITIKQYTGNTFIMRNVVRIWLSHENAITANLIHEINKYIDNICN